MKKIQGVFEDESNIAVNTTKKVEDMTPEEKSEFYNKKKQKIIGSNHSSLYWLIHQMFAS